MLSAAPVCWSVSSLRELVRGVYRANETGCEEKERGVKKDGGAGKKNAVTEVGRRRGVQDEKRFVVGGRDATRSAGRGAGGRGTTRRIRNAAPGIWKGGTAGGGGAISG